VSLKPVGCGIQDAKVEDGKEYRTSAVFSTTKKEDLQRVFSEIWCYTGDIEDIRWHDQDPGTSSDLYPEATDADPCPSIANFRKLCRIETDLSHLPYKVLIQENKKSVYYQMEYDTVLFYQGVELKAQMAWKEQVSPSVW